MEGLEEGTVMTHHSVDVQRSRNLLNKQGKESLGIRTLCPRPVPSTDFVGILCLLFPQDCSSLNRNVTCVLCLLVTFRHLTGEYLEITV